MDLNLKEFSKDIINDIMTGGEKRAAVEEAFGNYVKMRLREISIVDRIMTPQIVSIDELQRDPDDPENSYVEVLERQSLSSSALIIPFDGATSPQFIRSTYYVVKYNVIASPVYTRPHSHLSGLQQDIVSVVNDNIVEKIGNVKDQYFFNGIASIFTNNPSQSISAYTLAPITDPAPGAGHNVRILPFNEPDYVDNGTDFYYGARRLLIQGLNKFSHNAIKFGCWVMPETVWNGIYDWSQDQLGLHVGDIVIFGTKKVTDTKMLFDQPIITTQKHYTKYDSDTGEEINTYVFGNRPKEIELYTEYQGGAWVDETGHNYANSEESDNGTWIYGFAVPEMLGKNGIVDKIHFYAQSGIITPEKQPMIALSAWARMGVAIAHDTAVVRLAIPDITVV